jgi:phage virion morphogenesis protein
VFEIDVSTNGVRAFDDLAEKLQSLRAPLAETGALLERKAKQRFRTQKAPDGTPWEPLAPSTLAEKRLRKKPTGILSREGLLAASIAFNVSGNEVRVKPSQEYGIYHQTGTKPYKIRAKRGRLRYYTDQGWRSSAEVNHPGLPARPFMGFEPDDPEQIAQIFADHLES